MTSTDMTADELRDLAALTYRACVARQARTAKRDEEARRAHAAILARCDDVERELRELRDDHIETLAHLVACVEVLGLPRDTDGPALVEAVRARASEGRQDAARALSIAETKSAGPDVIVADAEARRVAAETRAIQAEGRAERLERELAEARRGYDTVTAALEGGAGDPLAPRTVLHVYRTLSACLDAARRDQHIAVSPCDLSTRRGELPTKRDADPTWRERSIFTREDMARIITDERIPGDRRVYYALGFLAGMRASEIAGLHWRDVDLAREPLGCVRIAVQAERDLSSAERETKTGDVRDVPIHPALAAILAAWKLGGYARQFARAPADDALVVPSRQDGVSPRSKKSLERMKEDLEAIGVPVPPATRHAMRATLITLLEVDGARESVTRRWTHTAHDEARDARRGYVRHSWADECREMARLVVPRVGSPRKVGLPEVDR